jgi:hypothetical protein
VISPQINQLIVFTVGIMIRSTSQVTSTREMKMIRRTRKWLFSILLVSVAFAKQILLNPQAPLTYDSLFEKKHEISPDLFADLEELSRIVDIAYCVGWTGTGIQKPFLCASRCQEFKSFQLVTVGRHDGI